MVDQISNVKWLWWRLEQEVKAAGVSKVAMRMGRDSAQLRRTMEIRKMRIAGLVRTAENVFDCSVAELFLDPSVETDWYKDAKPEYIPINLRTALAESGHGRKDLCKAMGWTGGTGGSWFSGRVYPDSENLQKIADYFEMEIADLFLPPKGVVE